MRIRAWHLVAALLAAAAFTQAVSAQKVITITLAEEKGPAEQTPADLTRQKLAKGMVDGRAWSLNLNLTETAMGSVLDYLSEAARAAPRGINIIIDRKGIEDAGIDLNDPVTLNARDVSLKQALDMVLGNNLGYRVQDDGTVVISSLDKINADLPRRTYDIREVLAVAQPQRIRDTIERTVRGTEPWESMGGRSSLDFTGTLLIVRATGEMHEAIVDLLKSHLVAEANHKDALRKQLLQAEAGLEDQKAEVEQLRATLRKLYVQAGRANPNPQAVLAEAEAWKRQARETATTLAGKQARLGMLQKQIADIRRKVEKMVADDPVITELQKVVQLREKELHLRGPKAPDDADTRERLTEAHIKLNERREQIAQAVGGDVLKDHNLEVGRLIAEVAELEHRQAAAEKRAAEINVAAELELADRIAATRSEIARQEQQLAARQALVDQMQREVEGLPLVGQPMPAPGYGAPPPPDGLMPGPGPAFGAPGGEPGFGPDLPPS